MTRKACAKKPEEFFFFFLNAGACFDEKTESSVEDPSVDVHGGLRSAYTLELNSYLILTGSVVCVVVMARNVLQVVHRVCPSGSKRLPLRRGCLVVDRQRVVGVGRGTGLRVHLGHLVAVHNWRGGHQHVSMRHGPCHGLLPELVTPHCWGQQQRILGMEAICRKQLLL